jgi:hypothetical protein
VGFDDRTADREPHTHATGFRGAEGIEQPVGFVKELSPLLSAIARTPDQAHHDRRGKQEGS